ncbi:MAG TPA: type II secretion system protein GspM [Gemmatimonadaceae bacterium]|jgi:hypothetical protein
MKWATMNQRDRRAVAVGGLVLLPFALFLGAVRPFQAALSDARDQLEMERGTLARERAALAAATQNPQMQHVADSVMRSMRPRLFEGKDDVMASSELAGYLGDIAERSRVWLQDAGTRPAAPAVDGIRTLHVEIRAESDINGALLFLQNLENGEKLVRVDRIDVSRTRKADDKDGETLSIVATVSGFAANDVSSAMIAAPTAKPSVAVGPPVADPTGGTPR